MFPVLTVGVFVRHNLFDLIQMRRDRIRNYDDDRWCMYRILAQPRAIGAEMFRPHPTLGILRACRVGTDIPDDPLAPMMDQEAKSHIQKASIGIDVATEHIANLELQVTELRIQNEKVLLLLQQILIGSGSPADNVEGLLRAADQEARRRVVSQQSRELKSFGGSTPPPLDQSN